MMQHTATTPRPSWQHQQQQQPQTKLLTALQL
jgi:hypothetical protein